MAEARGLVPHIVEAGAEDFFGHEFELPDRFNSRRLMRFAAVASTGVDTMDPRVLGEVDSMIVTVVRKEDHARFDQVCDEVGPGADELVSWVMLRVAELVGRPTRRSSSSPVGPSTTSTSSPADSSSRVVSRLEGRGRGDLALMVVHAQEAQTG